MAQEVAENSRWRTRSYIRQIGQGKPVRRKRRFWRLLVLAGLLAAVYALYLAVREQWFAPDGPGYLLYWVHDEVFLTLFGNFWTRLFPQSLIWAVPAAVLAGLICVELLTPAGLRTFHRRIIRAFLQSRLSWLLPRRRRTNFEKDRWLAELAAPDSAKPIFGGFALSVVKERHEEVWQDLRTKMTSNDEVPGSGDLRKLTTPLLAAMRLDHSNPRVLLAGLEATMIAPSEGSMKGFVTAVQRHLDRLVQDDQWPRREIAPIQRGLDCVDLVGTSKRSGAIKLITTRTSDLQRAITGVADSIPGAVSLGVDIVVVSTLTKAHSLPIGRTFFELVAAARLAKGNAGLVAAVGLAASLVDQEFWAARAEASSEPHPVEGDLAKALANLGETPDKAERFAILGGAR